MFFCLHTYCFCQIEWVDPDNREAGPLFVSSQGHHVLSTYPYPYEEASHYAIGGNGQVLHYLSGWAEDGEIYYIYRVSKAVELPDSSVAFNIVDIFIDAGGNGSSWSYTSTADWDWVSLQNCDNGLDISSETHGLELFSDGGTLSFDPDDGGATAMDTTCQTLWSGGLGFQFTDLAVTTDDRLLWAGPGGLTVMGADGAVDTTYAELVFERVQATSFGGIVGLRGDSLFLLATDLSPLAMYGLPDGSVLDLSTGHGRVAVLTANKEVHLLTDSLAFQHSFALLDESEFYRVDIGPEGLGLAGSETYGSAMPSGGTRRAFTKSYSFEGDNYDMSRDIGIVEIQLGEVSHVTIDPAYPDQYKVYFNDADVTVENFGDEMVQDFFVRSKFSNQEFTGLSLAANESITLGLDDFWLKSPVEPGGTESVCLWTTHPDKRLDEDSTNDGLCTDFLVNAEEEYEDLVFEVHPNPATGASTIHFSLREKGEAVLKAFDSLGRQVDSQELGGSSGTVTFSRKAPGLYYLTLFVDDVPVKTNKFVQL